MITKIEAQLAETFDPDMRAVLLDLLNTNDLYDVGPFLPEKLERELFFDPECIIVLSSEHGLLWRATYYDR